MTSAESSMVLIQKICRPCNDASLSPAGIDTFCFKCGTKLEPAAVSQQSQVVGLTLRKDSPDIDQAVREARSVARMYQVRAADSKAEAFAAKREARELSEELKFLKGEAADRLESAEPLDMTANVRFGWTVLHKFLQVWRDECSCDLCENKRVRRAYGGKVDDPRGIYWEEIGAHFPHRERAALRRLNELAKTHKDVGCNNRYPTGKYPEQKGYCSWELYGLLIPPLISPGEAFYLPNPKFKPNQKAA